MDILQIYNSFKELTSFKINNYLDEELGLYDEYIEPLNVELLPDASDSQGIDRINILFRFILWDKLFHDKYDFEEKKLLGSYKRKAVIDALLPIINNPDKYKNSYNALIDIFGRWPQIRSLFTEKEKNNDKEVILKACLNPLCSEYNKQVLPPNYKFCPFCGFELSQTICKEIINLTRIDDRNDSTDDNDSIIKGVMTLHISSDKHGEAYLRLVFVNGNDIMPDFFICDAPITQAQWACILEEKLKYQSKKYGIRDDFPMYNVNIDDCQRLIECLNDNIETINNILSDQEHLKNYSAIKFSLPSEAQWLYAAWEESGEAEYKYCGSDDIDEVAWYRDNSNARTHKVKSKKPNELGIYDMSGNVMEWCKKGYGDINEFVLMGGSWDHSENDCSVLGRNAVMNPEYSSPRIGVRLVLQIKKINS